MTTDDWITDFTAQDAYDDWIRPEDLPELAAHIAGMAADPVHVPGGAVEEFLWNLQRSVAPHAWNEDVPARDRRNLLLNTASILERIMSSMSHLSPAGLYFWDSVIEVPDLVGATPTSAEIRQELFDILVREAAVQHEGFQRSALHGLNHLRDPRTSRVIDSMRDLWVNAEVAKYAEVVKKFGSA